MITNYKVKKAIKFIRDEYKNGTHEAKCESCKLCNIFFNSKNDTCGNCPNTIFDNKDKDLGCVTRVWNINNLSWDYSEHKLVEFWTEVAQVFHKLRGKYVLTKELKAKILEIAEKYK